MVTRDGAVKILDFGLAKLYLLRETTHGDDSATAIEQTQPGTVMGTSRLHVARAGERQARGLSLRPVLARLDPLRAGDRQAGVPAGHQRRNADGDHPRGRRAGRQGQRDRAGAFPMDHRALPRQGPRGALRLDPRPRERPAQHPGAPVGGFGVGRGPAGDGRCARAETALDSRRGAGDGDPRRDRGRDAAAETDRPFRAAVLPADHLRQRHDPLGALRARRPDDRVQRFVGRQPAEALPQAPVEPRLASARAAELEPPRHLPHGRDGDRARTAARRTPASAPASSRGRR